MKKAEEKGEVKGKALKVRVIAILQEAKTNSTLGASVSSNSATNTAASNYVLKSILKKAGAKSSMDPRTLSFKEHILKSDLILSNEYVCQAT